MCGDRPPRSTRPPAWRRASLYSARFTNMCATHGQQGVTCRLALSPLVHSNRMLPHADATVDLKSRADAVRLAVHLLAGGDPAHLPDNWRSASITFPPGPASEYGHCYQGIANAISADSADPVGRRCNLFLGREKGVGLVLNPILDKHSNTRLHATVPLSFDMMMAGVPCLAIILTTTPHIIKTQVRYRSEQ